MLLRANRFLLLVSHKLMTAKKTLNLSLEYSLSVFLGQFVKQSISRDLSYLIPQKKILKLSNNDFSNNNYIKQI